MKQPDRNNSQINNLWTPTKITGGAIVAGVVLALASATPVRAGSISVVNLPATGTDAASGISSANTYLAAIDLGATISPLSVNGVAFEQVSLLGGVNPTNAALASFSGTDSTHGGSWTFSIDDTGGSGFDGFRTLAGTDASAQADGNMLPMLTDMCYISGVPAEGASFAVDLGGLTVGQQYSLRWYYRQWSANNRLIDFTFNGEGTEEAYSGNPINIDGTGAHYIDYTFTATGTSVHAEQLRAAGSVGGPHVYGLTLQQMVPEPSALALGGLGLLALSMMRRRVG